MKQIEQYRVWEVEAPAGASATLEMAGQMETVSGFAAGREPSAPLDADAHGNLALHPARRGLV